MSWEDILKGKYKPRICRLCGEEDETVSNRDIYSSNRQICQMCSDKKAEEADERETRLLRDD